MDKVAVCIVHYKDGRPFNVHLADTKDNAIRVAWMKELEYEIEFYEVKTGSVAYMRHEIESKGHELETYMMPVHK